METRSKRIERKVKLEHREDSEEGGGRGSGGGSGGGLRDIFMGR